MRNLAAALVFMLICISCGEPEKHGQPRVYSIPKTKIDSIALILSNASSIDGPAVGIAGTRSPEYDSYEWIQKNGTDSLLVELANYSNPYTKTYAFMALCKRKSAAARELFMKNLEDTTTINLLNGCIGSSCQLNQIWLTKIHPLLDSAESLSFARKIHKEYPWMSLCIIPD
jgi:hypothetical protein